MLAGAEYRRPRQHIYRSIRAVCRGYEGKWLPC
jgi:hypothetical protein